MNGNAVLGYQQHFDIEGDSGIVGRAFGTAAKVDFRVFRSLRDHQSRVHGGTPDATPAMFFTPTCAHGYPAMLTCIC